MNNRPDDPSDLARARSWRLRSVVRQWFVSSNQSVWWLTGSTETESFRIIPDVLEAKGIFVGTIDHLNDTLY